MKRYRWVLIGISPLFACGPSVAPYPSINPTDTSCTGNMAIFQVGDGFLQTLCGCTGTLETNQTVSTQTHPLTCHVHAAPAQIFFYYLGTRLRHQIISLGTPSFISSPMSDPKASLPISVHSVTLTHSNSVYQFQDAFSGIPGQIFVP